MATADEVQQLRRLADYHDADPYDDSDLSAMIDATSINRAAERLWNERAAAMSNMVDVSESGSSRRMGELHKNALAMSAHFRSLAEQDDTPVDTSRYATTRAAVRE